MLPERRTIEEPYEIPQYDLDSHDLENLPAEMAAFNEDFADCFPSRTSHENFLRYQYGQFNTLERKSIEPMAQAVEGGKVRALQQFISFVRWDTESFRKTYRTKVAAEIGDGEGVLIFDESSFVKKGKDSAGVARQYCGTIGKVENCQVGVFAAYASKHGYTLVDAELYVPEAWFTDDYKERREKTEIPAELQFHTKPQMAAAMLRRLYAENILPFKYVAADSVYGDNPDFLQACEECPGIIFFLSVASKRKVWLQQPHTLTVTAKRKGAKPKQQSAEKEPVMLLEIAQKMPETFWYRRKVSEGTKGPIEYEFCHRRIWITAPDKTARRQVDLIIKRSLGKAHEYWFYICNAPPNFRLRHFVWLSGLRWAIEQCFAEGKGEVGMDHYEVRKWPGWYHHMLTSMASLLFLLHTMVRLGKKSAAAYALAS